MLTRELTRNLFDHMEWADARIWEGVSRNESARHDEKVRALLVHTHSAQRAFLDVWTGQSPVFRAASEFPQLEPLYAYATGYYTPARAFLTSLDEARFHERVTMPWVPLLEHRMGRSAGPTTLGDTIMQVFSHTTHHRAQISSRLRALGGEPPMVDYIAWLWFDRPNAEWQPAGSGA